MSEQWGEGGAGIVREPPSVVVVGSVNIDLIVQVPNLPKQGETVTDGEFTRTLGGKGANQAAAAAKLGARVWLVGLTGKDEFGREARDDLMSYGVDLSGLGHSPNPTGVAAIVVDESGNNTIAVASGANADISSEEVVHRLDQIRSEDAVVLANLEIPIEAVTAAAETARRRGWRFVLNPAPARTLPSDLLALCDVITPNEHEARTLGSIEELLHEGVGSVVVTLGANGALLHRPGSKPLLQQSLEVTVVDSTGAGDAFNGTLAWSLARGDDLDRAITWAVAAGALACRSLGARAGLGDRDELEQAAAGLTSPSSRATNPGLPTRQKASDASGRTDTHRLETES